MTYLYVLGISLLLLSYVFYQQIAALRSDEREIRYVEQVELHLAHILRLLDSPDVRLLLENPQSRQSLLLEFSDFLRTDVVALGRLRVLGLQSLVWAGIFFLSYYLVRLKAHVLCGRRDLRFLSGLELALFRSLQ
jgi:hypothetical protein